MTALTANAQVQRVGLCEEATQASCPPCATLNPGLQTLMNNNTDKTLFMAYQVWWPGFDQMYLDNSAEVDARVGDYYGYEFAPQVKFNGTYPNGGDGSVATLTQAVINNNASELSEFDIEIDAEVVNGELLLTGTVTGLADASGDLVLHLALTEGTIYSTQATGGTNGETEYHHVFKKFLPGVNGMDIADNWVAGDTHVIDEAYPLGGLTIYNWDDLEVIAFVQNNDNKFIHHAVKDSDVPIASDYTNSAGGLGINNVPSTICAGNQDFSPTFSLVNYGSEDLTSATITYNINGGADQVYEWTGSLGTLGSEDVVLDPYNFTALSSNTITATVSMPNGVADEDASDNNTATAELIAVDAGSAVNIEILTDNYGSETTWELRNGSGTVVMSGGPYGNATTYNETYEVPAGEEGCYEFKIYDSFGDGICCGWGIGYYIIADANGNELLNGGEFTDEASEDFSISGAVGLSEQVLDEAIHIFPNPSSDVLNVSYNIETSDIITFDLINALGAKVATRTVANGGANTITFDVTNLDSGVYQLNTIAGNAFGSTAVTILK